VEERWRASQSQSLRFILQRSSVGEASGGTARDGWQGRKEWKVLPAPAPASLRTQPGGQWAVITIHDPFHFFVTTSEQMIKHTTTGVFFVVNSNKINHTNATRTSAGYLLESSWCFHFPATPLTIVLLCSFRKWSLSD
jgi:hypothetical protein